MFFQKNAHKTQESLISGMSDVLVKRYTSMLPIQGIKNVRPVRLFQKSAVNMTMSNVPTNPNHGVSWHMVWG